MSDSDWEDGLDEEAAAARAVRDKRRARRAARPAHPPLPAHDHRRWVAVGLVAVALSLAGVSAATSHTPALPSSASAAVTASASLPSVAPANADSAAWYCPGPLPVGTGAPPVSILLTSAAVTAETAQVAVATTAGKTTERLVTVPAKGSLAVSLAERGGRARAAAMVLVHGGGVAATEVLGTPGLPSLAACQAHTSAQWLFPSGSTVAGSDVLLSLFDPTTSPTDVDVNFASPSASGAASGVMSGPARFQGLTLQPNQLVVLDVGRQVQLRRALATEVLATSGRVVAGLLNSQTLDNVTTSQLVSGAGSLGRDWIFPLASQANGGGSSYWVFDPGTAPARVKLTLGLGRGSSTSLTVTVPGSSLALVTPAAVGTGRRGAPSRFGLASAELDTESGPPVVVSRGGIIDLQRPARGHRLKELVVLEPWSMLGEVASEPQWMLTLPGVVGPPRPRRGQRAIPSPARAALFLTTDASTPVRVTLELLEPAPLVVRLFGAGGFGRNGTLRSTTVTVVPGRATKVGIDAVGPGRGVLVSATGGSVTVEADLYLIGSSGGDSVSALPVG